MTTQDARVIEDNETFPYIEVGKRGHVTTGVRDNRSMSDLLSKRFEEVFAENYDFNTRRQG